MTEKEGLLHTNSQMTLEEMLNAIGDCLSNLASSDDGEDAEYKDDDEEDLQLGKRTYNDEPSWAMGTMCNTVQHRIVRSQ